MIDPQNSDLARKIVAANLPSLLVFAGVLFLLYSAYGWGGVISGAVGFTLFLGGNFAWFLMTSRAGASGPDNDEPSS